MNDTRANVRSLFFSPKPAYPLSEAALLLGTDAQELRAWVASGELEAMETDAGLVLPWSEVASFAMDWWSQEAVEEALGSDLAEAIPALLRLTDLEVRIPGIEVVALERVAARERQTISVVLARELRDFVSVHSAWLSVEVPGFAEALAWPELPAV
jgi:hypothetical protein